MIGQAGTRARPSVTVRTVGLRGYSEGRRAYDARRRKRARTPEFREAEQIVRGDLCGCCLAHPADAQIAADHIVPLNQGGEDSPSNLAGLCRPCNAAKGSRPLLHHLLRHPVGRRP